MQLHNLQEKPVPVPNTPKGLLIFHFICGKVTL